MSRKLIICDKNAEYVEKCKKAFENCKNIQCVCGDIIGLHEKTANSRIITASNPNFQPNSGLDYELAKKYNWEDKEFLIDEHLFYAITVNDSLTTNESIIKRAVAGVFAYSTQYTMIMPCLGCGIGGFDVDQFINIVYAVFVNNNFELVDLSSANLSYANLSFANLRSADLSSANLRSADLHFADLRSVDLSSANLRSVNLRYADLRSADLRFADLRFADLRFADLSSADLSSADLSSADLRSTKLNSALIMKILINECTTGILPVCPEEGSFIGWKKAKNETLIKLKIPARAKRTSGTTRKCRCSEAKVLGIWDSQGAEIDVVCSQYDKDFVYKKGEIVKVDNFDKNRWNECSTGIHFFITKEEAKQY